MQPWRPHGHLAPPILTTMWPISPAASRPSHSLPSSTTPPPTPVPQNTPSSELYGWPAPRWNSAIVATLTSLPSDTCGPSASCSAPASGKAPSQPGRLRALVTMPFSSSTSPGEPTPIEASSAGSASAAEAASRMLSAIVSATSCGPPVVGVGRRYWPRTENCSSTTTVWTFVPPRSTPARRVMPGIEADRGGTVAPDVPGPTPLERVRDICLGLPEVTERLSHGSPTWFIRDKKTFVMYLDDHHGDGRLALWLAAPEGMQAVLVAGEPEHYFVPPYVGHRGWVGVHLNRGLDWNEIAGAIEEAYLQVAPKRLADEAIRGR